MGYCALSPSRWEEVWGVSGGVFGFVCGECRIGEFGWWGSLLLMYCFWFVRLFGFGCRGRSCFGG